MDGLTWLLLSWAFVGGLCYLALTRLGGPQGESSERRSASSTTAQSGGGGDKEWANEIVNWLFNNLHRVPEPLEAWIKSLNEAAKKVTSPTKCEILFEGFSDHGKVAQPPKLSNIRVERGPRDHLTVRSHVHLPSARLRLVSSQRTPERLVVSNFDANIVDLRGEVEARLACIANQLYVMGCFNGRPEMEIELTNTDPNYQVEVDRALVEDGVRRCLLSAVTNVNLSETSLPVADRSSMPRMSPHFGNASAAAYAQNSNSAYDSHSNHYTPSYQQNSAPLNSSPLHEPAHDVFKKLSEPSSKLLASHNSSVVPNKLRVGVIKGNRLAGAKGHVAEPYVVIEMDEPAQKHRTTTSLNSSPFWEETFEFDLTPASEEILFEVYDAGKGKHDEKKFIGLAIVNFEEIRRSGESDHNLRLQGRPGRNDSVDGVLTCRFDFHYDPTFVSPGKTVERTTVRRSDGSEFTETVSTQRRAIYDPHDDFIEPIPTKTTTISLKCVEKPPTRDSYPPLKTSRSTEAPPAETLTTKLQEKSHTLERQPHADGRKQYEYPPQPQQQLRHGSAGEVEQPAQLRVQQEEFTEEPRGRGREKTNGVAKRDSSFFAQLREKLSGKGKKASRARSVDVPADDLEEAVSLPPSRDHSQTRWAGADGKNRRYFETTSVGGRSGESTRSLYQHSTLLLEIMEGGEKKYFLIPPNLLNEPSAIRLLKRGKKLHIYNEHTFVAVKIKGGAICNVCQDRIGRSFSKQAYQCRDCKMVCHKSCHYKTDAFCTDSSVSRLHIAKDVDWNQHITHEPMHEFISYPGV